MRAFPFAMLNGPVPSSILGSTYSVIYFRFRGKPGDFLWKVSKIIESGLEALELNKFNCFDLLSALTEADWFLCNVCSDVSIGGPGDPHNEKNEKIF